MKFATAESDCLTGQACISLSDFQVEGQKHVPFECSATRLLNHGLCNQLPIHSDVRNIVTRQCDLAKQINKVWPLPLDFLIDTELCVICPWPPLLDYMERCRMSPIQEISHKHIDGRHASLEHLVTVEHLEEIKGGSAIILIRVTPLFRLRSLALITFVPVGDHGLDSLESNESNTDLSTIAGRS